MQNSSDKQKVSYNFKTQMPFLSVFFVENVLIFTKKSYKVTRVFDCNILQLFICIKGC